MIAFNCKYLNKIDFILLQIILQPTEQPKSLYIPANFSTTTF